MPRSFWLLIMGMVVNVTGGSFLWPMNTIYMHEQLGKSLSVAGFVLMLNSAAGILGNMTGGFLFDKLGGYRSTLYGTLFSLFSLIGLTLWHGWPSYVLFLILVGFGSGVIQPAMLSLGAAAWKGGGRRAFNAMYVAQNIGVAIGTSLAGYIASISFEWIFIANTFLFFIFFLIVFVFYRRLDTTPSGRRGRTKGTGGEGKEKTGKQPYFSLALLSLVFCLSWIAYVQWTTTLSTYTQDIGISLEEYSFLWTVNGALIVLGQPLVALLVRYLAKSMKKQLVYGLAIFMGAFYLASVSRTFSGFLTAMVILTLGEMLVWPAIPAVADRLAPEGKRGLFQGIINSASAAGRMIGPVIGGVIVDHYGMGRLFSIMIFVFLIALFLVHFFDGSMKRGQKTKDMAAT